MKNLNTNTNYKHERIQEETRTIQLSTAVIKAIDTKKKKFSQLPSLV